MIVSDATVVCVPPQVSFRLFAAWEKNSQLFSSIVCSTHPSRSLLRCTCSANSQSVATRRYLRTDVCSISNYGEERDTCKGSSLSLSLSRISISSFPQTSLLGTGSSLLDSGGFHTIGRTICLFARTFSYSLCVVPKVGVKTWHGIAGRVFTRHTVVLWMR